MTRVPEPQPFLPEPGTNQTTESGPEHDLRALFGRFTAVFVSLAGPAHAVEAASAAFFSVIGGGQPAPYRSAAGTTGA